MNKTYIWILVISSFTLISCEKVIDLDLNSSEPRIVIEGNITSDPGPYEVSVTTSGDYYTAEGIQPISGATIILNDDFGNYDTLTEEVNGKYLTNNLIGESDRNYSIKVIYNNIEYTGSDYLPNKVVIDSLNYEIMENGHGSPNENEIPRWIVYCYFTDPAETADYYRLNIKVNGLTVSGAFNYYSLGIDQLVNGQPVKYSLWRVEAMPGDTISINLNSIGFNTYEYFRTLNDAISSGGMDGTPYNPLSNLSNDALGYFGAYTNDTKSFIVEY